MLVQIEIHERTRGLVHIDIFPIGDYTHNGRDAVAVFNLHGFADRILPRPIFFGHPMIHNDDFRSFRPIGRCKRASH